jgi:hypothetical protein
MVLDLLAKLRVARGGDGSRDTEIVDHIMRTRNVLTEGWPAAPSLLLMKKGTPQYTLEQARARAQVAAEARHVHTVLFEAMVELALLASGARPG